MPAPWPISRTHRQGPRDRTSAGQPSVRLRCSARLCAEGRCICGGRSARPRARGRRGYTAGPSEAPVRRGLPPDGPVTRTGSPADRTARSRRGPHRPSRFRGTGEAVRSVPCPGAAAISATRPSSGGTDRQSASSVTSIGEFNDLTAKIVSLHEMLDSAGVPHQFGGAIALACYRNPRATTDIDVNLTLPPAAAGPVLGLLSGLGVTVTSEDRCRDSRGTARPGWTGTARISTCSSPPWISTTKWPS